MPCNDVSEILEIRLDNAERVVDYSLSKQTCGGMVAGRGLIRDWVKGRSIDEIIALSGAQVLSESDNPDATWEYLRLKHLFSIQAALSEFEGKSSSDGDTRFVEMLAVDYGPEGVSLTAKLNVDVISDEIKACGLCGC